MRAIRIAISCFTSDCDLDKRVDRDDYEALSAVKTGSLAESAAIVRNSVDEEGRKVASS
jgi:hypothetical protein